ncbi:recombinase family protein [Vibrio parahaemolyticus]|nr:recombinase family protein [Vibrio parahaemolyticus]ELA7319232.1 recombinase family protein [Vibrio parahaemolyticus]HCG8562168.1 recombinase family protein [Vibrio parahaemolyticus]HCG9580510.1 recombinase family protein [Vibrio parahaemolyticus]HCH6201290.1 recombinase family protein [Vibrio parahaemolyticus]
MSFIGFARVSTQDQNLDAQIEALTEAGCIRIFHGKQSGKSDDNKAKLDELIDYVRDGDVVVITKLDRLGRSLNIILDAITRIQAKGAQVKTLDGQVDTSADDAMRKAMTQLLGVFAELEHSIIVDRLQSGRERTGKKGGRRPLLSDDQKKLAVSRLNSGDSISQIAKDMDVSRATVMRVVKN